MTCISCGGRQSFQTTAKLHSKIKENDKLHIIVIKCTQCGKLLLLEKDQNPFPQKPRYKFGHEKIRGKFSKEMKKRAELAKEKEKNRPPTTQEIKEKEWLKDHKLSDKELVAYAKGCKEGKWKSFEELEKGVKDEK